MLDFQYVEKDKIQEYSRYYDTSQALGLEVNLVSAYLWSREYLLKVAVFDGTLIKAYYRDENTIWGYCMPAGRNVAGAVEAIIADAKERGQEPYFGYMSQTERDTLDALYPGRFHFERSTTTQDYIYRSENLANLSGKKYHAKRNHISKFYRTYDNTEVREISAENRADVLKVVALWYAENGVDCAENPEYAVIREALENQEEFGMRGIVLYVDGNPIAMALGSELSPRCFDISFEKALTAYDGSYAVINQEFAKRLTAYEYINREEDLGLEGLRKAKLSYHPAIIYDRYDGVPQW